MLGYFCCKEVNVFGLLGVVDKDLVGCYIVVDDDIGVDWFI